jgi:hypothetical protein
LIENETREANYEREKREEQREERATIYMPNEQSAKKRSIH